MARQNQNSNQGIAKYFQRQSNVPVPVSRPNASQIQGNLSEDEALARALQASLTSSDAATASSLTQEGQDRMLALSLAQGEEQQAPRTTESTANKSCQIS